MEQISWKRTLEAEIRKARRELQGCAATLYSIAFNNGIEVPDWRAAYSDDEYTLENPISI